MPTLFSNDKQLRRLNNILTFFVLIVGFYIIALPFLPHLSFWWAGVRDDTAGVRYVGALAAENEDVNTDKLKKPPKDNRLVLPQLRLDEKIVTGDDPSNIHAGVWARPNTSTPDKGGNTVLVGHRFSYSDPAVFGHLDKMKGGDAFAGWWKGEECVYEVFNPAVVEASAIAIEANSDVPIMTLYTCTPVWTAEDRLVIQAKLLNTEILDKKVQT